MKSTDDVIETYRAKIIELQDAFVRQGSITIQAHVQLILDSTKSIGTPLLSAFVYTEQMKLWQRIPLSSHPYRTVMVLAINLPKGACPVHERS